MRCLHPILINAPRVDKDSGEVFYNEPIYVPCRKCIACKSNRRSEWSFRLLFESLDSQFNNYFITLTYTDETLPVKEFHEGYQPCFKKDDYQRFFKRLRKHYSDRVKLRFFLSTEYGSKTLRPHAHAVIFNVPDDLFTFRKVLEKTWSLGRVQADCLNPQRMGYVSKYIMKQHFLDDLSPSDDRSPFMLCSKGIGRSYADLYTASHHGNDSLIPFAFGFDSVKMSLPRYLKNKVFTDSERLELAEMSRSYNESHPIILHKDYILDKQLEKHFNAVLNLRAKL